jgi:octaheme c-type cytochrome (tetrathionate reductase family)
VSIGRGIIAASIVVVIVLGAVLSLVFGRASSPAGIFESPWDRLPSRPVPTDHARLIRGPLEDGPSVTRACLECHPDAAQQVMATSHWTWAGQKVKLPGRDEIMRVGKRNLINNFCIHAGPNMEKCSSCHAGYGWKDDSFDFQNAENVDCLVCHDQTGTYRKGDAGHVAEGVDLVRVAQSVGSPTRNNCGQCHFKGGGGDAVKHGDLDGSMYFPPERIDVHMGKLDFACVDCHRTKDHRIPGCAMSVCIDTPLRVNCTDCHSERPHHDDRLDAHTQTVACQTCHIPRMAIDAPTKMVWDWSAAGQDGREEDPHVYLKKKGSFQYAQNIRPEYHWYNGTAWRYLTGDKIDPGKVVRINYPLGSPGDPGAKIWPFKVHRGKQVYDKKHQYLLAPKTAGPGGYWSEFDWDKACRLGSEAIGLPYSGEYAFVETEMYWPLSHMVQPKEKALQCHECHGARGIMNWTALGFDGDPAFRGDRHRMELIRAGQGGSR